MVRNTVKVVASLLFMKMRYMQGRCNSARRALQSKLSSAPNFTQCRSRTSGMISSVFESIQESCLWKLVTNPSQWLWRRNRLRALGWQWESIRESVCRLLCCKGPMLLDTGVSGDDGLQIVEVNPRPAVLLDTGVSGDEGLQIVEVNPRPAEAPTSPYLVFNDLPTGQRIVRTSHELYGITSDILYWFARRREVGNESLHVPGPGQPLDLPTGQRIVSTRNELYGIMRGILYWFVRRREVGNIAYFHVPGPGHQLDARIEVAIYIDDLEVSSLEELSLLQTVATRVNWMGNWAPFQVRFPLMQSESDGATIESSFPGHFEYSIDDLVSGARLLRRQSFLVRYQRTNGNILSRTQLQEVWNILSGRRRSLLQAFVANVEDPDRQHLPQNGSRLRELGDA